MIEGQDAVFTIQVTDAAPGSRLTLSLADGTALDADYFAGAPDGRFEYRVGAGAWTAVTGPIDLIDGGDITLEVRTDTIDDQIDEPDETFHLNASLAQGSTTVATASGSATILDNDEPGVVINPGAAGHNINVIEGQDAVFTIQVTDAAPGSRLTLSLADGTALDADYFAGAPDGRFEYRVGAGAWTAVTGPIDLIDGGDITLEVRTDTIDDQIDEPDETFHLNASLAQGARPWRRRAVAPPSSTTTNPAW
ncbi:MAG: hypothetical protein IPG66_15105 [Hydrogenophilales bacterium]|nr:hypothetical protein [Hydrogenophilales bacterium]